jgi:hypothetical protein
MLHVWLLAFILGCGFASSHIVDCTDGSACTEVFETILLQRGKQPMQKLVVEETVDNISNKQPTIVGESPGPIDAAVKSDKTLSDFAAESANESKSSDSLNSTLAHDESEFNKTSGGIDLGEYGIAAIPVAAIDRLVMSSPYKCDFLISADEERHINCGKTVPETGIDPANLSGVSAEVNTSSELRNALRIQLPIGSLPCCTTAPFCAAPDCSIQKPSGQHPWSTEWSAPVSSLIASGQHLGRQSGDDDDGDDDDSSETCTKRSASKNYRYMVHPEVYPAYYGFGGSYEVDVQKHWDVLSVLNGFHPVLPPFDLVIDLGAGSGLVTEKLVMRRFAQAYIMVDIQSPADNLFARRFGDPKWRDNFVAEATATWPGAVNFDPRFEWLNYEMSDGSADYLGDVEVFTFPLLAYMSNYMQRADNGRLDPLNTSVPIVEVDRIIPGNLSEDFTAHFAQAQSAYVRVKAAGMDQNVITGMVKLLEEKRDRGFLVNFMMLEFCAVCMERVRKAADVKAYDLRTLAETLEELGFEAFIIGPRYLPITHGSWDDDFLKFTQDPESSKCNIEKYPKFHEWFPKDFADGQCNSTKEAQDSMVSEIFAMRASHPKAAEIKLALGACKQSQDFVPNDPQYDWGDSE